MGVRFPSLEFFEALQQRSEAEAGHFESLGPCDALFGVAVDGFPYTVEFEGYCVAVALGGNPNDLDFVLSAPAGVWREMLESIVKTGGADASHRLEALTRSDAAIELETVDEDGVESFRRYLPSLQAFFDQAQQLEIDFD